MLRLSNTLFIYFLLIISIDIYAQDTLGTGNKINLVKSDSLIGSTRNGVNYTKLYGNVILEQQGTSMACDSAYWFKELNHVEAYSNVHIVTNSGSTLDCQYLKYLGNSKIAYLKNEVVLIDGSNELRTNDLEYHINTKLAKYRGGGTLQNDSIKVTSMTGTYSGRSKDAFFKEDVMVVHDQFIIESRWLKFNQDKKVLTFLDESVIQTDNETIITRSGNYDIDAKLARLESRSRIERDDQIIEAKKIYYDQSKKYVQLIGDVSIEDQTGEGTDIYAEKLTIDDEKGKFHAVGNAYIHNKKDATYLTAKEIKQDKKLDIAEVIGNVYYFDSINSLVLWCDRAIVRDSNQKFMAKDNVVFNNFKDGQMIYCDSLYNDRKINYILTKGLPVILKDSNQKSILTCKRFEANTKAKHTLATGNPLLRTLADKDSLFVKADTLFTSTKKYYDTHPRLEITKDSVDEYDTMKVLIGQKNVKIFMDSMQAICDSMGYSDMDSIFRLYKKPILWNSNQQAKGDTIYITMRESEIRSLEVLSNSSIIEYTYDEDLYQQAYGRRIVVDFDSSQIREVNIYDDAESIYFYKNENDEYIGMNECVQKDISIYFEDKKIRRISFKGMPKGNFYPMDKLDSAKKKSSKFEWLSEKRPKNKNELIIQ